MDYEIIIETMEEENLQEEIYRDVLCYIIKEYLSEVDQNGQSYCIPESIY
ncbi:MAG TPA: hypothetical protein VEF53_21615 [Patescibacteria group bacterium]|nr:hypothetical protein [Patescibacteria group bacterium]